MMVVRRRTAVPRQYRWVHRTVLQLWEKCIYFRKWQRFTPRYLAGNCENLELSPPTTTKCTANCGAPSDRGRGRNRERAEPGIPLAVCAKSPASEGRTGGRFVYVYRTCCCLWQKRRPPERPPTKLHFELRTKSLTIVVSNEHDEE